MEGRDGLAIRRNLSRKLQLRHGLSLHDIGGDVLADYDRCLVLQAFHVTNGEIEGVDVSGTSVVLLRDTPPPHVGGNWRSGLIIDADASQEQADALQRVFSGQAGGPFASVLPLVGEDLGVERAPIAYADDGRRHRVSVGDDIDVEIEDFVPRRRGQPQTPDGEVSKLTGLLHRVNSTLTIARAQQARVKAFGMEWDSSGKNGHSAPFKMERVSAMDRVAVASAPGLRWSWRQLLLLLLVAGAAWLGPSIRPAASAPCPARWAGTPPPSSSCGR